MKKLLFILSGILIISISCWAFVSAVSNHFEVPVEGITFHEVPLVCNAAPDIGCGSRSKPILLDLQKESTIKEAWLNRQGTVTAIVWEKGVEHNVSAVPAIFKKHGKSFKTLKGEDYKTELASFKSDRWYKGKDVDELSKEEAGLIAKQITDQLVEFNILSEENESKMRSEVAAYIQIEFITLEDVSLLNDPAYYARWEKAIQKIGAAYVDGKKMPEMEIFYPAGTSCQKSCSKNSKVGCSKEKSSCSSKKKS